MPYFSPNPRHTDDAGRKRGRGLLGLAFWGWQRRGACVPFHRGGSPLRAASFMSSSCWLAPKALLIFYPGTGRFRGRTERAGRAWLFRKDLVNPGRPLKRDGVWSNPSRDGVPGPDVTKSLRFAVKHRFSVTPNRAFLASTLGWAAANPHSRVWHPEGCEGFFLGCIPRHGGDAG